MSAKVPAVHKLTGDTQMVRPEAVDRPGGFFESPPKKPSRIKKREAVETPVADEATPDTESDPATGAPNITEE